LAQAVAGSTGVFPSILWLDLGNDERTVNENTDSPFKVAADMKGREAFGSKSVSISQNVSFK